jgi:hypothetical protein
MECPDSSKDGGRDPPALQTITQDRIIPHLLSGILALSACEPAPNTPLTGSPTELLKVACGFIMPGPEALRWMQGELDV